jgi:hypothetical protein
MAETDDERDRPHRWESWNRVTEGHATLARYVAPAALRSLRLAGSYDEQGPVERVAEQLFERLRAQNIKPAAEPRVADRGVQLIRDPRLLLQDGVGTCLDMATTYASMLDEAQIGTLLAVTRDHAFVVATAGRLQQERFPSAVIALDGFAQAPDERTGVLVGPAEALTKALKNGAALAIDAVQALHGYGDYAEATAAARRIAASEEVRLVDVPYLHGEPDFKPFDPTVDRPAIHLYVPDDDVPFFAYPSHAETIEQLRNASGTVVLRADSGWGKSRIARELARDAPLGAGWFLDASEARVLMKSFADADRNERQEPLEQAAGRARLDREGFADSALAQLGRVTDRWVVVLDNADGDPGEVERLMPRPGRDQLVLITSTNPDWGAVPGVRSVELPPIAARDIEAAAGGDPDIAVLTELIDGRPLLLRAFQSLLRASAMDGASIAARAPSAAQAGGEERRGPTALWAALRAAPAFGEEQLRASAFAAYLPPDRQPLAVFEALAPGSAAAVRTLVDHGLLTYELHLELSADARAAVRMHRLFGAAVRADLEESAPELCDEVVRQIAAEPASRRLLDVRGDLDTVRRLEARLLAQDDPQAPPDAELGRALHGLAWLLELHGQTRDSGDAYERAQRHLEAADLRTLVADCLHGRARIVNQHHQRDPPRLREAVAWAREARRILLEEPRQEVNADRCLAMEGLLLQKLAAFPDRDAGQTTLGLLEDALRLIEEADENRRNRPEDVRVDEAELARSMFNRAGVRIRLAREQPEEAARHLDLAQRVYDDVWRARIRIYRRELHPHIAACIAGLAYVAYYRAMLIPASARQRSEWLRIATDRIYESIKQREALEGPIDLDEATKNARFLAKVALARTASPVAAVAMPRGAADEAIAEMTRAGVAFEPVAPLPSGRERLPAAIEAWARSHPVRMLVAQFGDVTPDGRPEQPPADTSVAELLAWLHDFSGRHWDFRNGRERNLATTPRFAPEARVLAVRAAAALGLMGGTRPPQGRYEHVLILGGLVRGCLARPLHAAALLRDGVITAGAVTALGAFRRIDGDEHGLVERVLGDEVSDELHAMDAGVRNAFGVNVPAAERGEESEDVGASWRVLDYRTGDGQLVRVVAAPSTRPGERANTPDTYAWFASELAKLQPGERVLVVTTQIYAPYQHADALRMLALTYGVEVDVTGVVPGDAHPGLRQSFGPDKYLQEIRSTIRALRDLHAAL